MLETELIQLVRTVVDRKFSNNKVKVKAARESYEIVYDTLSSFSNTNGGVILFGIDEKDGYAIKGVYDADDLIKKVSEQTLQMEPNVRPVFTIAKISDAVVVSCEIAELAYFEKPCFYKGKGKAKGSYIRVGDSDIPMSDFEIYNFEVYKRKISNEGRTIDKITNRFIDENMVNAYIGKLLINKPNMRNISRNDLMTICGLESNNLPTLCNILIFGKYPQMISPLLDIVCTIPATDEYGISNNENVRFIDNKRIDGTLIDQINGAISFVSNNMKKKTIINNLGKRVDEDEYPLVAIREAILNAVIHRDYSVFTENIPISVTLFQDRIEIENPGSLYGTMTIEDLGKKKAEVRNPYIATIMETLLETENRNSGIPTMINEMKKANLLPPKFENFRDSFKVTFYNQKKDEIYSENVTIEKIVEFCNKPRSKSELAAKFGFDKDRPSFFINNYISPLVKQGILKFTIPEKPKSKNNRIVIA